MLKLLSAIVGSLFIALLFAAFHLWVAAIGRLRRGEAIVPFEPRPPVPWGLLDLLLICLLWLFTVYVAQGVAVSWWRIPLDLPMHEHQPQQLAAMMLASGIGTLASCLASLALVQFRAGATRKDFGLALAGFWRDVKLGAGAFVMLAPPMYLLQIGLTQIWKYEHPVQTLLMRHLDGTMLLITLFTAVAVAPLAEEVFFRVLLQGWLENASVLARKALCLIFDIRHVASDDLERDWRAAMIGDRSGEAFSQDVEVAPAAPLSPAIAPLDVAMPVGDATNPYASPRTDAAMTMAKDAESKEPPSPPAKAFRPGHVPLVLTAAIFAAMHYQHGPAPIPLFFLAIGLGYLYRQTHRATPSIVVHCLVNAVSIAVLWASLVFKS